MMTFWVTRGYVLQRALENHSVDHVHLFQQLLLVVDLDSDVRATRVHVENERAAALLQAEPRFGQAQSAHQAARAGAELEGLVRPRELRAAHARSPRTHHSGGLGSEGLPLALFARRRAGPVVAELDRVVHGAVALVDAVEQVVVDGVGKLHFAVHSLGDDVDVLVDHQQLVHERRHLLRDIADAGIQVAQLGRLDLEVRVCAVGRLQHIHRTGFLVVGQNRGQVFVDQAGQVFQRNERPVFGELDLRPQEALRVRLQLGVDFLFLDQLLEPGLRFPSSQRSLP